MTKPLYLNDKFSTKKSPYTEQPAVEIHKEDNFESALFFCSDSELIA
jgi:hypothetical protein